MKAFHVLYRISVGAALLVAASSLPAAEGLRISVSLSRGVIDDPALAERGVTGRLYVFLSQRAGEPRMGPNWFAPEPFYRLDVAAFRPGQLREVDAAAAGFPVPLSELPPGKYRLQAVLDHALDHHDAGRAPGNIYSNVADAALDPAVPTAVSLVLDRVIAPPVFPAQPWLEQVTIESRLLSNFHGRKVVEQATVVLPGGYADQPQKRYPVIYSISGFGGSHLSEALRFREGPPAAGPDEVDFIRVLLDGNCRWGHHVYADSATNGPRGRALVEELIPMIDARYRTVGDAAGRFLAGHSSGGWASLWLQVNYPDTFGGVWSSSPDPVDFRDYQQVNLYADPPQSLFVDEQGRRRPIARRGNVPVLWYDSFSRMDDVIERGGQLRSFEAVFSPLDAAGLPARLWDRQSGRIDPQVARAWQKYDLRLLLEQNWETLQSKLQGKLHVASGSLDTFYLEGAVGLLAESLQRLGSDARIEIVPGADHSSLLTPAYFARCRREMSAAYRAHTDR